MVPACMSQVILIPSSHLHGPRSVIRYFPLIFALNSSTSPWELPIIKQSSTCTATTTILPSTHLFTKTPWSVSVRLNPICSSATFNDSYQLLAPWFSPYRALCNSRTCFLGLIQEPLCSPPAPPLP